VHSFRVAILFQACLLLSLESLYSPAYQMALDMLHRLNTAHEEIVEVLLSKKQVIPSMRQVYKHITYSCVISGLQIFGIAFMLLSAEPLMYC